MENFPIAKFPIANKVTLLGDGASPDVLASLRGPTLKRRGGEGKGRREEKEGRERGKEGRG